MKFIDQLASLPYRIFGVLLIVISVILALPLVVLPMFLTLLSQGRSIEEAYGLGHEVLGKCTLRELLEMLRDATILTKIAGFFIDKIIKGLCMIYTGVYYLQCYEEVVDMK